VLVIVVVALVLGVLTSPRLWAMLEVLTPPGLPAELAVAAPMPLGDQNWTPDQAERFHFESQGTHTIPVPLSWFLALEAPLDSPFAVPFASRERFADNRYLLRFGFIGAEKGPRNPDGLPIGFAISPYHTIDGLSRKETAVGLTCAACHTGQLVFKGKRYIVEGGPAATDLGQLTKALAAALGQTALSEKLRFFDGRFDRFARAVLQAEYNAATRYRLAEELDAVVKAVAAQPNGVAVTEGFTRLDALNRIGNQVFAVDTKRYDNAVDVNAPVNYPHIWTASWFDWVQYDGSIMQPLVRNAGEAMGVRAQVVFDAPPHKGAFSSSIPFDNLSWIETLLAGEKHPLVDKAFGGLHAPSWPADFPPIDPVKAATGAKLYEEFCTECHRPALTRKVVQGGAPDDAFWTYFKPIRWRYPDGAERETKNRYFRVRIMPQKGIGSDPAQGEVLAKRKVDTAGRALARDGEYGPGLGINAELCLARNNDIPEMMRVTDSAMQDYPTALGAVVHMAINEWFGGKTESEAESVKAKIPEAEQPAAKPAKAEGSKFEEDRPNCLQAGAGYKARPLNGVWATAPFLHNGSVPTLYDLLSPVSERPKSFLLGDPTFDPVNVGLVVRKGERRDGAYDDQGYFILDTSTPGNRNTGHEFAGNKNVDGVIGRALSRDERYAIIEFLKTL
jgi:mono/diheme cytochrome c family protein